MGDDVFDELVRALEKAKEIASEYKVRSSIPAPEPPNPHDRSYRNFGDSPTASILFMDIIGYSKLELDDDQKAAIELLNRIVTNAIEEAELNLHDVVCLPTGDGMCLCFTRNTEGPLKVAAGIHKALAKENKKRKGLKIQLRMGVNLGIVHKVKDLKGADNLVGATINISQRAMNCGDEWHILCTEKAYDELRKLKVYKDTFVCIEKPFKVKHEMELKLYNHVCAKGRFGNPNEPRRT